MPSNRVAGDGAAAGWASDGAAAIGAAPSVAARSANGDDSPNVAAADCATSRYSAESTVDALAGNVTHPSLEAGSIDVY